MDTLFRPVGDWQQLSRAAVVSRRINSLLANLIFSAGLLVTAWMLLPRTAWALAATAVACTAWTLWRVIRAGRWARAFAFREGERDLLISRGLWFRSLSAIPYGRMLSVEVTTGPVSRLWGLADVQLVTASSSSNATIPSLTLADASRLRDDLIARGEEQALPL